MPAQKRFFKFLFLILGLIFWAALRATPCYGTNLLENPGFEEEDIGWSKYGSTQLEIVDNDLNGTKAGALTSNKSGAKYIYQEFDTLEGEEFQLSGWIKWDDDFMTNAKLRVEWYNNSSIRVGLDEISLASRDKEWQYLACNVKAPPSSKKAKFEAYAYFNKANPLEPVLFDDLFFSLADQSQSETPTPTQTPTPTPIPAPVSYPSGINISEFVANPETGDDEWVEIHNTNSEQAVLTDWYIDDKKDGGASPKKFSATISADSYYVINFSSGTLNNDGDDVRLLNPDSEEIDSRFYSETTKGKSWSKDSNGNWCQIDPTKGQSNSSCPSQETSSPTSTPTPTPQLTSTSTLTPTKTPTPTPTPSGEILGATEGAEATSSLLLESEEPEEESEEKGEASPYLWPKVLIGLGAALIIGATYPFWLPKVKMLYNSFNEKG